MYPPYLLEITRRVQENQENANPIKVEQTSLNQSVNLYNCSNTTVVIEGKINALNLSMLFSVICRADDKFYPSPMHEDSCAYQLCGSFSFDHCFPVLHYTGHWYGSHDPGGYYGFWSNLSLEGKFDCGDYDCKMQRD